MKRIVLPAIALVPAITLVLAGCGSAPEAVDSQVRQQLITRVDAVKTAALGNDRGAAEAALAELNREIAAAQAQGKLNSDSARAILAAADRVAEDVRTIPLPAPPPPVVVTVTPTQPELDEEAAEEREQMLEEQLEQWEKQQKQREKQRENHGRNDG
jgi:FtsZ-interacting cell division protein ZipA